MKKPNILIVKLSAIGDVIHTLPAVNAVRRHYPSAHITWLVEEAAADLVRNHPALDRVLVSRRKAWFKGLRSRRWPSHLSEIKSFIQTLRDRTYDLVFDFQASLKGAVLIAFIKAGRKIGFGPGLEHQELSYWVLNERVPAVSMEIHALDRGLMMLDAIGIPRGPIEYRLPVTTGHRLKADRLLTEAGLSVGQAFMVINPVAKWDTKLWDQVKFAETADRLHSATGLPVIFSGGPEDRSYNDAVISRMRTSAVNLAGRTNLMTLAALLEKARLMITTDTGPMHMAAAVKTRTVALFGPTAPWRTGPHGPGHRVVRAEMPCGPCFKRGCTETVNCMDAIGVEAVIAAAQDLLASEAADMKNSARSKSKNG